MHSALAALLRELVDGAPSDASFILNPHDPGLLRSLDKLSARRASTVSSTTGSSIAAHVDHVRYGLEAMNRWSRGENPFADADYSASWRRTTVTDDEWVALRERLRSEAQNWIVAIQQPRELNDIELTGIIGSIAHLAYHLGAIRQIDVSTRGPLARD